MAYVKYYFDKYIKKEIIMIIFILLFLLFLYNFILKLEKTLIPINKNNIYGQYKRHFFNVKITIK